MPNSKDGAILRDLAYRINGGNEIEDFLEHREAPPGEEGDGMSDLIAKWLIEEADRIEGVVHPWD